MLERRGLIDLERSLRDTLVLSVYLDAPSPNPAERDAWRTRLDQELERVRKQITERPERRAFDRATGLLRDELESGSDAIGAAGWMGVVAPDDIRFRTPLAVSPPLSVHWGRGMFVTPALRALEAMRPAHGASTLRRREDLAAIERVIEQADAGGRARIRIDQVEHALELGAVQQLFISAARAEEQPGAVEILVREALDTDADVEVVSGDGAELLNAKAEGIAALLRFTPPAEARTTDERTRARRSARHLDGAPSDIGGA